MKYVKAKALDEVLCMPRGDSRWYASIDTYTIGDGLAGRPVHHAFYSMGQKAVTYTCVCCKERRKMGFFPKVNTVLFGFIGKAKDTGQSDFNRTWICYQCLETIGETLEEKFKLDKYQVLFSLCAMTGVCFNYDIAKRVIEEPGTYYDDTPMPDEITYTTRYFRAACTEPETKEKDFWDPAALNVESLAEFQKSVDGEVAQMDDVARENRSQIIAVFHQDPFANETMEDRVQMYNDLVTMMDDAMNDDLVRQKAAIEIVRAFKRIDKTSEAIRELQSSPESVVSNAKDLKQLIEQKSRETTLVTNFSKDHGFAEKYALSKSKGSGTLSAIVREMRDLSYDRGAVNRYDIETSAAIKQVSDISAESIFKQIQFSDSEYAQMVKEQAEEMVSLREQLNATQEELRLFKEKHLKQELLEELRLELKDKGIADDDIEAVLQREIRRGKRKKGDKK